MSLEARRQPEARHARRILLRYVRCAWAALAVACAPASRDASAAPKVQVFPTIEAAALQGQRDLLGAHRAPELGVSAEILQRAEPGKPIARFEVDFAQLLAASVNAKFSAVGMSVRSVLVPLVDATIPVAVMELGLDERGYRITALALADIARDLALLTDIDGRLTLYEVPYLHARIYGAISPAQEVYYTDYRGRFTLREAVPADVLLRVLRADAFEFARVSGERLDRERMLR